MPHAQPLIHRDAPPLAACAWSLGIHAVLFTVLVVCADGPAGRPGGTGSGGWCIDASWMPAAGPPGAGVEAIQAILRDALEIVPSPAVIPPPEPAASHEAFPKPLATPRDAAGEIPEINDTERAAESAGSEHSGPTGGASINGAARPGAGRIGKGTSRFFSLDLRDGTERPLAVVFVIDHSESMKRHGASGRAQRELLRTLGELTIADRFQVVLYNTRAFALAVPGERDQLLRATDRNRRLAEDFLHGALVDGGTDHMAAMDLAFRLQPETIVLLTDGDEPELSARQLATIRRLNRRQVPIHTIQFGDGPHLDEPSFLAVLSGQNSGTHAYHDLLDGSAGR